jgi:hypothetical protein
MPIHKPRTDSKPTVKYHDSKPHRIRVGLPAYIYPLEHPSERVTGDGKTLAVTSPVILLNRMSGEFWTHNTHYVRA